MSERPVDEAWAQVAVALRNRDDGTGTSAVLEEDQRPGVVIEDPDQVPGSAMSFAGPAGWQHIAESLSASQADRRVDTPKRGATSVTAPTGWQHLSEALAEEAGVEPAATEETPGSTGRSPRRLGVRSVRPSRRVVAVAVAVAVALGGGSWVAVRELGGGLPAGVAFRVDGKNVPVSTLNSQVALLNKLYGVQEPPATNRAAHAAFVKTAAKALAVNMLIDDIAARKGIVIASKTARDYLSQLVSRVYAGNQSQLAQVLASAGLNETQLLGEIRHQLLLSRLFAQVVGTVTVSNAQQQATFAANRASLAVPETRAVSHILVSSQAEAQSVAAQVKAGKPFAALAAQYSLDTATKGSGGSLGTVEQSELMPSFAKAAFSAPLNVPFVVQDPNGWEVGMVTAINAAKPAVDDGATQTAIKTYLADQVQLQRWDRWLAGQLRDARIRYAPAYRPPHPDAPPPISLPSLAQFVQNLAATGSAAPPVSPASP